MKLRVSCEREAGRYLCAFFVVLLLGAVTYGTQPIFFESNDDVYMMFTMAGYASGKMVAATAYSSELLGCLIGGLYRVSAYLPWYTLFYIALIFVGEVLLCKTLIKVAVRRAARPSVAMALYAVFSFVFLFYAKVRMQYTLSAGFAGSVAIALIFGLSKADGARNRKLDSALICLFLLLSYMIRPGFFPIMLCFVLLALGYQLLRIRACSPEEAVATRRTLMPLIGVCAALVLAVAAVDAVRAQAPEWRQYTEYNAYRTQFSDYHKPFYEEAENLYASIGWTPELVGLAHNWFFMDRRINTEAFKTIASFVDAQWGVSRITRDNLSRAIQYFFGSLNNRSIRSAMIAVGIALIFSVFPAIRQKKLWPEILLPCLAVGGLVALCLVMCFRQRFLLRAFLYCAIPAGTMLLLCLGRVMAPGRGRATACVALLLALLCYGNARGEIADTAQRAQINRARDVMEAFSIAHPQNVYIFDITLAEDSRPFVIYPDEKPINLLYWGGWEMHSPMQKQQLAANGMTAFFADVLLEDGVYLMTASINAGGLMDYMRNERGAAGYDVVDELPEGVLVVRFFANR